MKSINKTRIDYNKGHIREDYLLSNPVEMFNKWMSTALTHVAEPNAFVLSTVNEHHEPSSRVLLLRDVSDNGFVFFTNYLSQKGKDIAVNPKVSMNFFWPELEHQLRINGQLEKVSETISDAYFQSRPYDSRIGAWSSPQSQPIDSRQTLDDNVSHFTENILKMYPDHHIGEVISFRPNKWNFGKADQPITR